MMIKLLKNKKIVGEIEYNSLFDYTINGKAQNPEIGKHLGFSKVEKDVYCLIYGSDWKGENSYAEIVPSRNIVVEAIKSQNIEQLKNYPGLQKLYEKDFEHKKIKKTRTFAIRVNLNETNESIETKIEEMKQNISDYQNLKK